MKNKRKTKKFKLGGNTQDPLEGYLAMQAARRRENPIRIESPGEAIYNNQMMLDRINNQVENDPWTKALDAFGGYALATGSSMAMKGINTSEIDVDTDVAAYGTSIGLAPIELEGGEVAQTPEGNQIDFSGPSHEQGGILLPPGMLPPGSEVFSGRIKIDGVNMAKRGKKRKNKEITLEKLLEMDPTDSLVKNAMRRTQEVNAQEEAFDIGMQGFIRSMVEAKAPDDEGEAEKFLFGTTNTDVDVDEEEKKEKNNYLYEWLKSTVSGAADPTFGDLMGMFGNYQQGQAPLKVLEQNRAGDTANVNSFLDYGKDSLNTMQSAKDYTSKQRDLSIKNIDSDTRGIISSNRNSARGVGNLRALDLGAHQNSLKAKESLYESFSKTMAELERTKADLELRRDDKVMTGEETRDNNNRLDRDNYYTQLGEALMSQAQGVSMTGKSLNDIKTRKVTGNAVNSMFDILEMDPMTGRMKMKEGAVISPDLKKSLENYDYSKKNISKKDWDAMPQETKIAIMLS